MISCGVMVVASDLVEETRESTTIPTRETRECNLNP
jgi:hypothetical protein